MLIIKRIAKYLIYTLYLLLTLIIGWGRFWKERGFHAEQYFYLKSLYEPGLEGFFYNDSSRIFMSFLYHLGFKLTNGSFLGIHFMFGITVVLTALFSSLILNLLGVKNKNILVLIMGMITINGAEHSMNVPSMIIVKQSVVAALAAILIILFLANKKQERYKEVLLIILLFIAQTFSLWSYEPGIGLITGGLLLLNLKKIYPKYTIIYIIVPIIFLSSIFARYFIVSEVTYQSRKFSLDGIYLIDQKYGEYLTNLVNPLKWTNHWANYVAQCSESFMSFILPYVAAIIILTLFMLYLIFKKNRYQEVYTLDYKSILFVGTVVLLSYLPFVFVVDGSGSWRTHFYAIPVFGILIGIILNNLSNIVNNFYKFLLSIIAVLLICTYTYSGTYASLASQLEMSYRWNANRNVSLQFLNDYPQVRDHTLLVLLNYPNNYSYTICKSEQNYDNFGDAFWFTAALKMIYPYSDIRGIYVDMNGISKSSGATLIYEDGYMGFSDSPKRYGLQDLIVYEWNGQGVELKLSLPANSLKIGKESVSVGQYKPKELKKQGKTPPNILRNFNYDVSYLP